MQYKKISFIGAGNMTSAIITGLVGNGYPASMLMASNPSQEKLDTLTHKTGINTSSDNSAAVDFADVVVLAVKPQILAKVCQPLAIDNRFKDKCVVSIAAGITTQRLSDILLGHANIIRVMPNTPSAIGMGMSGIYAAPSVSKADIDVVTSMMEAVGEAIVVGQETLIDAVIACAGSSPAYFFLIAEVMIDTAMHMGLNESDSRKLVQQAMLGSAQILKQTSDMSPAELRAQVTSKGGTTHAAVESLKQQGLPDIFANAMHAAVSRAQQMAKEF